MIIVNFVYAFVGKAKSTLLKVYKKNTERF